MDVRLHMVRGHAHCWVLTEEHDQVQSNLARPGSLLDFDRD